MPDVKYEFVRGNSSGIDGTSLKDGQILFDKQKKTISLDATVNGTLTRINMSGDNTFNGTTAEWNALTDTQKEKYQYVYITDDYEYTSSVMTGATASSDGTKGLVPQPLAGDQDKVLYGDGTWKEASSFSGDYNDLTNKPTLGTAAEKNVATSGDAGSTEVVMGNDSRLTDSRNAADVSSWAKAATKPSYTATEVGAYTKSEVDNKISTLETNIDWKEAVATYDDIATTYPNPVDGWTVNVKDTDYTYRYNGSTWVAISANAIPQATTSVNGLMTTTQVTKLNGIATGAEVNVQSDWSVTDSSSDAFIKNKPSIPAAQVQSNWTQTTSTAVDYIKNKPILGTAAAKDVASSGNASTSQVVMGNDTRLSDARNAADVYSWAKASTKPSYTASEVGLGNVGNYKAVSVVANQGLTDTEKANARANIGAGTSSFSGNYNDLSNKPTIPTVNNATLTIQKNGTNVQTFTANASSNVTANITMSKSDVGLDNVGNFKAVSTVASQGLSDTEKSNARANIGAGTSSFSGSYNDLTNKPTIPTVNNATLTIQKNGTDVKTFTANASSNVTANITVPTKVSELTNDSGYTTNAGTITGITMNGASKGTSGVVNLGTVITAHQDISGKADKPTVKSATLAANATSVTFTGIPTSGNNMIDFFISDGANYTAINTATSGQITLTYAASSSARTVYCRIEGV